MSETKLEKSEVLAMYGDVLLTFSSYYKYSFTFSGVAEDGAAISATVGGDSNNIYRFSVTPASKITLNTESHYAASVHRGDEEIWSEYTF
jgi:hypothetical protein